MSIELQSLNEALAAENAHLQLALQAVDRDIEQCGAVSVETVEMIRSLTQGGQPQHLPVQTEQPEAVMDESNGYRLTYDALESLYFAQCSLTDELAEKLAAGSDKALQARIAELESDLAAMNRKYMALNSATPCPPSSAQGNDEWNDAIEAAAKEIDHWGEIEKKSGSINVWTSYVACTVRGLKRAVLPSSAPIEERDKS